MSCKDKIPPSSYEIMKLQKDGEMTEERIVCECQGIQAKKPGKCKDAPHRY